MPDNDFNKAFPNELQGFPGIRLSGAKGESAFIARQGAQVISWQGEDGRERLYLSSKSGGMKRGDDAHALAAAIRGGVPICFPQFSDRGRMVKHGFVRGMPWQREDNAAGVRLSIADNTLSRQHWPHAFRAGVDVTLSPNSLKVALTVSNTGQGAWAFTAALHTYLNVADILGTHLQGLHHVRYQDATNGNVEIVQQEEDIAITGEVDRVYLSPPKELLLLENNLPSLRIKQDGFEDTVVWNPGPEKARVLKDLPDGDWLRMLCVEAANVVKPVTLEPGETWQGSQTLVIVG